MTMGSQGIHPYRRNRRGSTLIFVGVCGLVFIGLTGLAVDGGHIYLTANQLQNAADAAALAGAGVLAQGADAAKDKAVAIAGANHAAGTAVTLNKDADIWVGHYYRTSQVFSAGATPYNAVKVTTRRPELPLLFGPFVGVSTANVQESAIAMVIIRVGAGVIVLDETAPGALTIKGGGNATASLTVNDGDVAVNSNDPAAMNITGSHASIATGTIYTTSSQQLPAQNFSGDTIKISDPLPDPLADVPEPDVSLMPDMSRKYGNNPPVIDPGYYPTGLPKSNRRLTLNPGIYAIGGALRREDMVADGVMFYLANETSLGPKGYLDLQGNSNAPVTVTPPTSGTYQGISIFQARGNDSISNVQGNSSLNVTGTIYIPSGQLVVGGDAQSFGNQLIVDKLLINGTVTITINYDGSYPIDLNKAFLVK